MPYQRTIPLICEQCGGPFLGWNANRKRGTMRFCSRACHYAHSRAGWRERFWANVNKTDSCWLWTGKAHTAGYGKCHRNGGTDLAHRVSWELHYGPVPDGLWVLHNCPGGDNPACVNPAHLFLGTPNDNQHDMVAKGRHCHGTAHHRAKLTEADVRSIRARRATGEAVATLAGDYRMSLATIRQIVDRRSWKHVNP
jgi:hypothetical protein